MIRRKGRLFLQGLVPLVMGSLVVLSIPLFRFHIPQGGVYDSLLSHRRPIEPNRSLLLIEAEPSNKTELIPNERESIAEALLVLAEMEAASAVITIPLEAENISRADADSSNRQLSSAFDKEFSRISSNISTLFEAMRTGSIRPKDTKAYVQEIVDLVSEAKNRLYSQASSAERSQDLFLASSAGIFGKSYAGLPLVFNAENGKDKKLDRFMLSRISEQAETSDAFPVGTDQLKVPNFTMLEGFKGAGFTETHPVLGMDGSVHSVTLIRRNNMGFIGNAAFIALLDRLGSPRLLLEPACLTLSDAMLPGGTLQDIKIPLAENGQLLIEKTENTAFRRLPFASLVRHQETEQALFAELKKLERAGFLIIKGNDLSPVALHEYASALQEELAVKYGDSKKFAEWREVRERFISSCKAFLESPAEKNLIQGYENLLKTEKTGAEVASNIKAMQKNVRESFDRTRIAFQSFVDIRKDLRRELTASFCLIDLSPYSSVQNDALLVNTILSERFISILPVQKLKIIAIGVVVATSLALFALPPAFALLVGCLIATFAYALAAASLVFNGLWVHPLVPALAVLTVTFFSVVLAFFMKRQEGTRIRAIFKPRLSKAGFRHIKKTAPELTEGLETSATILAIRVKGLSAFAGTMDARTQLHAYRLMVSIMAPQLTERGGALLYTEGESLLAAFGAPISFLDHAQKGCEAALALAASEQNIIDQISELDHSPNNRPPESSEKIFTLNVGLDTGICIFGSAGIPGSNAYSAFGHMPDRAKMLAVLGNRYNSSILITESTRNAYGPLGKTKKLDRLVNSQTNEEEPFYELLIS